jgi:hypothetical protein
MVFNVRRARSSVALLVVAGGCAARPEGGAAVPPEHSPATCSPVLGRVDSCFSTSAIELVQSQAGDGWAYRFYRNHAYPCAASGHHTFLLVSREGTPDDEEHPLWVRLHGGGSGAFDPSGNYSPEALEGWTVEETWQALAENVAEEGLVRNAKEHARGFRFLVPSMCDHDHYSGVGAPDPNNPGNPDAPSVAPTTDGLLAVRAALVYTRGLVASPYVFAHGNSAGAGGAMTLAYALGLGGERLSGAVLDSFVLTPYLTQLSELGCTFAPPDLLARIIERGGPFWQREHEPHRAIARGQVLTPLFHLWSREDKACHCGGRPVTVTAEDGRPLTALGCELMHEPLSAAIRASSLAAVSRDHPMCVDGPDAKHEGALVASACDLHSPTKLAAAATGGDTDRPAAGGAGEDYNAVIMQWVEERLGDAPVP